MTAPDKQNTAHPGPDALSQRMREHGIEAFRPLDINGPRSLFRGRDSDQRCDVLVVEVQPAAALEPADVGPSDAPLHAPKTHITLPYRVLQIGERSFGLFSQVKGMTLRENTDMMAKLRRPFHEDEILRVARALYASVVAARACKYAPLIHGELITVALDGSLHVIALGPEFKPASGIAEILATPLEAIESLFRDMASVASLADPNASRLSPRLAQQLQTLSSALEGPDDQHMLGGLLTEQTNRPHPTRHILRKALGAALLVIAMALYHGYRPTPLADDSKSNEALRIATEDVRSLAQASAKEWAILASSERLTSPIQALDAEFTLAQGDELYATDSLEQAKTTYNRAQVLFVAAIAVGKEAVRLRTDSENARALMNLSRSRWIPLLGSVYARPPDSTERADDAVLEGDFQYLQQHYREAVIAYELARQLYDAVPPDQFNALMQTHLARTARDKAIMAASTWERLELSAGTTVKESANLAKQQMAAAEGLLQAGQDQVAAHTFEEAASLFDSAVKSFVSDMVAQVATTSARERAVDAAQRWLLIAQTMKDNGMPEDIEAARTLLENGHALASEGKQQQARTSFDRAAALYELQIEETNAQAKARAEAYEQRAQILLTSLVESHEALNDRWKSARQDFENIHARLAQPIDPNHHEQLLTQSQTIRQAYRRITKLRAFCSMNVYGGSVHEEANSMLGTGQAMMARAEYVAASALLETSAAALTQLSELPVALEDYLVQEDEVSAAKEAALGTLGPLAQALPEIKRLLDLGHESITNAANLLQTRAVEEASQSLSDAKLTFESVLPQAEVELLNHARIADSELRTKVAIATLKELIEINPGHVVAIELMRTLQSTTRPKNRVTLIRGQLRVDGKRIPSHPTAKQLRAVLGKPSREQTGLSGLVYDDQGLLATLDPQTGKVLNLVIYYAQPRYQNEPSRFYPGVVEIEGYPIGRDDSIKTINAGVRTIEFKPTRINSAYQATHLGLRLLISYHRQTSQIYSISVMFLSDY